MTENETGNESADRSENAEQHSISGGHETEVDGASKRRQLDENRREPNEKYLTTDHGVRIDDTDNSLTAGERGPTLMEDFHFREKMTHFDYERIPERVVHARGTGAHGYFQPYEDPDLGPYDDISDLTKASFLAEFNRG